MVVNTTVDTVFDTTVSFKDTTEVEKKPTSSGHGNDVMVTLVRSSATLVKLFKLFSSFFPLSWQFPMPL